MTKSRTRFIKHGARSAAPTRRGRGAASPKQLAGRWKSIAAWSVSLLMHVLLLLSFTAITWAVGVSSGTGEAEVGIVVGQQTILDADIPLQRLEQHRAPLQAVELSKPTQPDQITDLGSMLQRSQEIEALIEIDLASGADAGAIDFDWGSLGQVSGGSSDRQGASFFGLRSKGESFIFVVDYSGSMRFATPDGPRLDAAKAELKHSIRALSPRMKFHVIFFDHVYREAPDRRLVKATRKNIRRVFDWVDSIPLGGGTDPEGAMLVAIELRPDVIWLLTDGGFAEGKVDVIRQANRARAKINTIAFYDNKGSLLLQRIAKENRGEYRFIGP